MNNRSAYLVGVHVRRTEAGALRLNRRSAPLCQCATGMSTTYSCFPSSVPSGEHRQFHTRTVTGTIRLPS
jgi:hypothetical protein